MLEGTFSHDTDQLFAHWLRVSSRLINQTLINGSCLRKRRLAVTKSTVLQKPLQSYSLCNTIVFVCVENFRLSQSSEVTSNAVSLPNQAFTGQAKSSYWLTSIVHILSPETDNCPS